MRERFNVVLGEHTIGLEETPLNAFAVGIEEILIHPEFSSDDITRNDIALLRLKSTIDFNAYVQPACLPDAREKSPIGQVGSVAGWGYTKGQ